MKRWLKALPFDAAFIGLCVWGFFLGNQAAHNLAYFLLWVLVVIGLFLFADSVKTAVKNGFKQEGKRSKFFKWWDVWTDIALIVLPVMAGYWVLGAFLTLTTAVKQSISNEADKEVDDEQNIDGH
jgi:hypothetical protein